MTPRKDIPIILADTSAIRDLMQIEHASDQLHPAEGRGGFSATETIDKLCIDGKRTMIMPGSILKELFPTITGRLSIATNEQGKPVFPIGVGRQMFPHDDEHALYQYFSKLAQEGKIRCYDSPAGMIQAGEIDHPKGGLVFVSMGEKRAPGGQTYSESKAKRATLPEERISEEPDVISEHKDAGDKDLFELTAIIERYTHQVGSHVKFMLLNSDGGLFQSFNNPIGAAANFARPLHLIHSMARTGMLSERAAHVADNSVIALAADDKVWAHVATKLMTGEGREILHRDVSKVSGWLEATKPADTTKRPTR